MGRPRVCTRCKWGDKGDGMFRKYDRWDDIYLKQTNKNRQKYGEISRVICNRCVEEIKKQGHLIRKDGKQL